jgi:antitoxin HigA-1
MARARMSPMHPGVYLRELLAELEVSQYRLAQELAIPAMRISHVVRGQRPMTAALALRLGRYLGQSPQYWLHLQSRYDLDVAEDQVGSRVMKEVRRSKAVA